MTCQSGSCKPRIGLLALSLELYEELAPQLRASRRNWLRETVIPRLSDNADIVFDDIVFTREAIAETIRRFENDGVDALLVLCATYSPSQLAIQPLLKTRLPILVWNTQELFAVDADFDGAKMIDNHGVHGTQDLCNVLLRTGVPFEYVTSHLDDADAVAPLAVFFSAAAAVAAMAEARVGLMGYAFPGMGDFAVDTTHLVASLGCSWKALSVEEYVLAAEQAPAEDVERIIQDYRQSYEVAPDLTPEDLEATARAEWASRAIVSKHRLNAWTYQFTAFGEDERTQTLPFVAASRMMADGIGFGGEGDLVGAAGSFFLNRLCPPATFSEIFTTDFGGNGLFMSHMGEANVAMARQDRKVRLVARPNQITRTRKRQLALVTALEPGSATLFALTIGPNQTWRMIASAVEIADFGPLDMQVPNFKITCGATDVRDWLTAYAKAGGPHHNAICFGDARRQIAAAARLLRAEYVEV